MFCDNKSHGKIVLGQTTLNLCKFIFRIALEAKNFSQAPEWAECCFRGFKLH